MKQNTESATSVMMTQKVSCRELSWLANYRLLCVSIYCCLIFVWSVQEVIVFMPVASALTGALRDCLSVAFIAQEPEIQCIVSRGQIVSTDLP